MKQYARRIIAIVALAIIVGVSCYYYTWLVRTDLKYCFYDFYHYTEKNTVDVLCLGSSHMDQGINPIQLYQEYGMTAFDLDGGSQSIWNTYYYLEEALKTQTPQVVLIDVYTITDEEDAFKDRIQLNLLEMEFSPTKYRALRVAGAEDWLQILLRFPITHGSYDLLKERMFVTRTDDCLMGYDLKTAIVEPNVVFDTKGIEGEISIIPKAEEYLRKTVELCKKQGISVVLVNAPCPCLDEVKAKKYNYVKLIADDYGIDFINGAYLWDELGMDWQQDCSDTSGHLNHIGVTKFTEYVGAYLNQNFSLVDHRGQKEYVHWVEAGDRQNIRLQEGH